MQPQLEVISYTTNTVCEDWGTLKKLLFPMYDKVSRHKSNTSGDANLISS